MEICELAFNMCERCGTECKFDRFMYFAEQLGDRKICGMDKRPARVYLGYEFCERMFAGCNIEDILLKIEIISIYGFKVTFVFPVLHQNSVEKLKDTAEALENQGIVDEWVINDIGAAVLLRNNIHTRHRIIYGRMFEKGIRDVRCDIRTIDKIKDNFDLLQPAKSIGEMYKTWGESYGITGIETDTFPDGVTVLSDSEMSINVHYPDIYLSSSAYCSFDENGMDLSFQKKCSKACEEYLQCYGSNPERRFFKLGNVLLCRQERPVHECIKGKGRLVYSDRISGYRFRVSGGVGISG